MNIDYFKAQCGHLLSEYEKKQIYPSEMLLFCSLVAETEAKEIVESGPYHGHSTEILANVFPAIRITSYEMRRENYKVAKRNLKKYANVTVINDVVNPKKTRLNQTTAVLIDGPKGKGAIALAEKVIDKVKFVAIHDMSKYLDILQDNFDGLIHSGAGKNRLLDKAVPYIENHHLNGHYGTVLAAFYGKHIKTS